MVAQRLPERVIMAAPEAMKMVERLSKKMQFASIDVDFLLDLAVRSMVRPHSYQDREEGLELALDYLRERQLQRPAARSPIRAISDVSLPLELSLLIKELDLVLVRHNLYTESRLFYHYEKRQGRHSLVLRRQAQRTFDP